VAQQSDPELPTTGRDGSPKRMVVQWPWKDKPFVRAPQGGPALVRNPVGVQLWQHRFTRRADNLQLSEPAERVALLEQRHKRAVIWHARVADACTPWVGVIVQDGDVEKRIELTGVAPGH
jgi:hypothetical protein